MFHIQSVEIEGFWGKHKIGTDFFTDVNIFIGKNGTGKTTFMNILQGILEVDIQSLIPLEFDKVIIKLRENAKVRTIKVERKADSEAPFEVMTFRVGSRSFPLQVFQGELNYRRQLVRHSSGYVELYQELKSEINELVKISSLSVHRGVYSRVDTEEYVVRNSRQKSTIDERLEELMQQLTKYQLSLELQARKVSSAFEKEVLVSMLYDEQFDRWDLQDALNVELGKEKIELSKAYRELKALDDVVSKKIEKHIRALNASLKRIQNPGNKGISIQDIFPLSLLRRTQHIINLTKNTEEQKQEIFQPINQYIKIILDFVEGKEFKFSPTGELLIFRENKRISISQLSSGEKQLLILLTETLLQKNQSFIFLADEPELSLHIEWQAMIIDSIRKLNQNAQIIVATHSPEIAGGWGGNIIDMEDILNG